MDYMNRCPAGSYELRMENLNRSFSDDGNDRPADRSQSVSPKVRPIINKEVGVRIHFLRDLLEMNQPEFASHLGSSKQTVNQWETGRQRLSLDGARAIVDRTGYDLDFIYFGDLSGLKSAQIQTWNDWLRRQRSTRDKDE